MSSTVKITEKQIAIALPNGVEIDLAVTAGEYNGIAAARLDGTPFLVPGRGGKPYFVTPDGVAYHSLRFRNVLERGAQVIVEIDAVGFQAPIKQDLDMFLFPTISGASGEVTDTLEVILEPLTQDLNDETYRGFSLSYAFRSASRAIHWMFESIAIAPAGILDHASLMTQHLTSNICRLEEELTRDSVYANEENYDATCIQAPCRGGGSQLYDLVQGSGLAVVTYFAAPGALKAVVTTKPGEDFVTVSDFHYQELSSEFITQPRIVLAAKAAAPDSRAQRINRWTAWYDYTTTLWQKALGISHSETLPVIAFDGTGGGGVDPGCTYPELLTVWAERMGWLQDNGIRGIILHTPEWLSAANQRTRVLGGNNCTPSRYLLSDHLGGDEGMRKFCEVAHAHGVKVYVWISGHLWIEALAWRQHPEWVVRNVGNLIWDGHYHCIHAMSFVHGAREWMAADLKHLRDAAGVDGVWFDSFTNISLQAINYQSPKREPNAPAVLAFLGDLSKMGYEIMVECMSQLGVSSWGNLAPGKLQGQEELLYNSSLRTYLEDWLKNPTAYSPGYYFRTLAARSPIGMWIKEFMGHPAEFPLPVPEWVAPLNRAYAKVEAHMRFREVLEDGAGVLWRDAQRHSSAMFAFQDGTFTFETSVVDLMTGKKLPAGPAQVENGHIYAFQE